MVTPSAVVKAKPEDVHVSFPPLATTHARDITNSFCCHVRFLAGAGAAESWEAGHPGGHTLDVAAAFELGEHAVAPLLASERGMQATSNA